jgi:acyl-coenzyme A synthetase/AMP-(fatty) acid ligase
MPSLGTCLGYNEGFACSGPANMNQNVYTVLASGFPKSDTAPCMILADGRAWTYADVERASGRMANLIVALGLKRGDRVAAQVEKTPEALVLYLAAVRAGMVFLPLNPAYQRHELDYFLRRTRSPAFLSAGRRCGRWPMNWRRMPACPVVARCWNSTMPDAGP